MIAATLVSMVALGFAAMYGTSQSYLTDAINASDAQGEASMAMEHVTRKLRVGKSMTWSAGAVRTLTITYPLPPGGADTVGQYVWNATTRTLTWTPNTSVPGDSIVAARNMTDFTVTDQGDTVLVDLQVSQGSRAVQLHSSVFLRGRNT